MGLQMTEIKLSTKDDKQRFRGREEISTAVTAVTQFLASAFSVVSKMLDKSEKSKNRKYSSTPHCLLILLSF